jgi:nitrogen regulatory protein PII
MDHSDDVKALFVVVNAGFAEDVIETVREAGVTGATIFSARGEGHSHKMFMGITVDTEKELILSIAEKTAAEKAMEAIKQKAGIQTPAHSICFTLPVEKMIGVSMRPPQAEE